MNTLRIIFGITQALLALLCFVMACRADKTETLIGNLFGFAINGLTAWLLFASLT